MPSPEDIYRRLKPIDPKAEQYWQLEKLLEGEERREFRSRMELHKQRLTGEGIEEKILLDVPDEETCKGEYPLGIVWHGDTRMFHPFALREEELPSHISIFGLTGSGKTNTALQILRSIPHNFIVFDWKRSYRDLMRKDDVRAFTSGRRIAPLYFNPLAPPVGKEWEIPPAARKLEPKEMSMLTDVNERPFDGLQARYRRLGMDGKAGLEEKGRKVERYRDGGVEHRLLAGAVAPADEKRASGLRGIDAMGDSMRLDSEMRDAIAKLEIDEDIVKKPSRFTDAILIKTPGFPIKKNVKLSQAKRAMQDKVSRLPFEPMDEDSKDMILALVRNDMSEYERMKSKRKEAEKQEQHQEEPPESRVETNLGELKDQAHGMVWEKQEAISFGEGKAEQLAAKLLHNIREHPFLNDGQRRKILADPHIKAVQDDEYKDAVKILEEHGWIEKEPAKIFFKTPRNPGKYRMPGRKFFEYFGGKPYEGRGGYDAIYVVCSKDPENEKCIDDKLRNRLKGTPATVMRVWDFLDNDFLKELKNG